MVTTTETPTTTEQTTEPPTTEPPTTEPPTTAPPTTEPPTTAPPTEPPTTAPPTEPPTTASPTINITSNGPYNKTTNNNIIFNWNFASTSVNLYEYSINGPTGTALITKTATSPTNLDISTISFTPNTSNYCIVIIRDNEEYVSSNFIIQSLVFSTITCTSPLNYNDLFDISCTITTNSDNPNIKLYINTKELTYTKTGTLYEYNGIVDSLNTTEYNGIYTLMFESVTFQTSQTLDITIYPVNNITTSTSWVCGTPYAITWDEYTQTPILSRIVNILGNNVSLKKNEEYTPTVNDFLNNFNAPYNSTPISNTIYIYDGTNETNKWSEFDITLVPFTVNADDAITSGKQYSITLKGDAISYTIELMSGSSLISTVRNNVINITNPIVWIANKTIPSGSYTLKVTGTLSNDKTYIVTKPVTFTVGTITITTNGPYNKTANTSITFNWNFTSSTVKLYQYASSNKYGDALSTTENITSPYSLDITTITFQRYSSCEYCIVMMDENGIEYTSSMFLIYSSTLVLSDFIIDYPYNNYASKNFTWNVTSGNTTDVVDIYQTLQGTRTQLYSGILASLESFAYDVLAPGTNSYTFELYYDDDHRVYYTVQFVEPTITFTTTGPYYKSTGHNTIAFNWNFKSTNVYLYKYSNGFTGTSLFTNTTTLTTSEYNLDITTITFARYDTSQYCIVIMGDNGVQYTSSMFLIYSSTLVLSDFIIDYPYNYSNSYFTWNVTSGNATDVVDIYDITDSARILLTTTLVSNKLYNFFPLNKILNKVYTFQLYYDDNHKITLTTEFLNPTLSIEIPKTYYSIEEATVNIKLNYYYVNTSNTINTTLNGNYFDIRSLSNYLNNFSINWTPYSYNIPTNTYTIVSSSTIPVLTNSLDGIINKNCLTISPIGNINRYTQVETTLTLNGDNILKYLALSDQLDLYIKKGVDLIKIGNIIVTTKINNFTWIPNNFDLQSYFSTDIKIYIQSNKYTTFIYGESDTFQIQDLITIDALLSSYTILSDIQINVTILSSKKDDSYSLKLVSATKTITLADFTGVSTYTYTYTPYSNVLTRAELDIDAFYFIVTNNTLSTSKNSGTFKITSNAGNITVNDNQLMIEENPIVINFLSTLATSLTYTVNLIQGTTITTITTGTISTGQQVYSWYPYILVPLTSNATQPFTLQYICDQNSLITATTNPFYLNPDCLDVTGKNRFYNYFVTVPLSWKAKVSSSYLQNEVFNLIINNTIIRTNESKNYNWVPSQTITTSGELTLTLRSTAYLIYTSFIVTILNASPADYGSIENSKIGLARCSTAGLTPALARATTNTISATKKKNNIVTTTIKLGDRLYVVPCEIAKYLPELKQLITKMSLRDALLFLIQKYNIPSQSNPIQNIKRYQYPTTDAIIKYPIIQFNTSFRLGNPIVGTNIITNNFFVEKVNDASILEVINDDTKTFSNLYTDMLKKATYWISTLPAFKDGNYTYCVIRPTNGELKKAISGSITLRGNVLVFTPLILKNFLFFYQPYLSNTDITITFSNISIPLLIKNLTENYFKDTVNLDFTNV